MAQPFFPRLLNPVRTLLSRLGSAPQSPTSAKRRTARPQVEALEDKLVPSVSSYQLVASHSSHSSSHGHGHSTQKTGLTQFNGSYNVMYNGTATTPNGTIPLNGNLHITVNNGVIKSGSQSAGTVSKAGAINVHLTGVVQGVMVDLTLNGHFTQTGAHAAANGTFNATFTGGTASGTFNATKG